MVNFKKLSDRAKDVVEKRGGTDALKADAKELGGIVKGKGSLKEKAAKARGAVSDPGKKGPDGAGAPKHDKDGPAGPREAASPGPAVPGSENPPVG